MGIYLVSNIEYPASQYEPAAPEVNGVYHEDREVNISGAVGASQMYRTYNAQFVPGVPQWQTVTSGVSEAYATTQDPDGSIHYYSNFNPSTNTFEPTWTTWFGSDNNNVYNAVDYGLSTVPGAGVNNTAALINAITAIINAGGGTLFLPAGKYQVSGPIVINPTTSPGIIIAGVAGQTEIEQQAVDDIFDVTGVNGGQGLRFRDLRLSFKPNSPTMTIPMAAVNVMGSSAVTCENVYFHNCPVSFITDTMSENCGLVGCWIDYDGMTASMAPLNGQTMISLSGSEDFVRGCVIFQAGSQTACTAIALGATTNGRFVSDTHISDFATGIAIAQGGIVGVFVSNVLVNVSVNAVLIVPNSDVGMLYDIHFSNCTFAATPEGGVESSGVVISTSGGANANVAGIYFVNCSAYGWGNAGIEIDGGQNIVITGGQYSSNGKSPSESYLAAGIAILGGAQVTISGADCSGYNAFLGSSTAQAYGIAVHPVSEGISDLTVTGCNLNFNTANGILIAGPTPLPLPTHIFVQSCDLSQYSSYSGAVSVAGTITHVQDVAIINCPGYNDRAVPFSPTLPTGTFYNSTYGYYGPVVFYVWGTGADTVTIGSLTFGLGNGSYNLPCNIGASVGVSGGTTNFAMIGM